MGSKHTTKSLKHNCQVCNREFSEAEQLTNHLDICSKIQNEISLNMSIEAVKARGIHTYKCNHCTFEAVRKDAFQKHKRIEHGSQYFGCQTCDYVASNKSLLGQHQKSVHEKIKYKCSDCERFFTSKGSLYTHKKSKHEGKRYPCDQCDFEATQKHSTKLHKARHHKVENPKNKQS